MSAEARPAGDPEKGAAQEREADAEPVVTDAVSAPDADGVPRRATRRFPRITRDTARPEGGAGPRPVTLPRPPGSGRSSPCWPSSVWGCC